MPLRKISTAASTTIQGSDYRGARCSLLRCLGLYDPVVLAIRNGRCL